MLETRYNAVQLVPCPTCGVDALVGCEGGLCEGRMWAVLNRMVVDVVVLIPSIPPRGELLRRALLSVCGQRALPRDVCVGVDVDGAGPAAVRDALIRSAVALSPAPTYVTFLDDDDEMFPGHIETMWGFVVATGAVMVYPWPETVGGVNPHEGNFGREFDLSDPCQTTVVTMVRASVAAEVGFRTMGDLAAPGRLYGGEDLDFTRRVAAWCLERGEVPGVVHIPERTWRWNHHGGNTSGLPCRWRDG